MSAEGERQVERARLFAEGFLTYAGESELCGDCLLYTSDAADD